MSETERWLSVEEINVTNETTSETFLETQHCTSVTGNYLLGRVMAFGYLDAFDSMMS